MAYLENSNIQFLKTEDNTLAVYKNDEKVGEITEKELVELAEN